MRFICLLYLGVLVCSQVFSQPKNRLSLGYHQGFIVERNDWSDLGLQVGLEHQLSPRWSVSAHWAMEDYCRCDLKAFRFLPMYRKGAVTYMITQTSPTYDAPSFSRFHHWSILGHYALLLDRSTQRLFIGTGITYRPGYSLFYLFRTPFDMIFDYQASRDWAIPIRLAYRYDPPYRWWGLTAFVLYQGYFRYQTSYLGNNPMNVMQAGVTFDIRLGRRERLER